MPQHKILRLVKICASRFLILKIMIQAVISHHGSMGNPYVVIEQNNCYDVPMEEDTVLIVVL